MDREKLYGGLSTSLLKFDDMEQLSCGSLVKVALTFAAAVVVIDCCS